MRYQLRNFNVFVNLEAIFEKLEFGTVRVDFEIHNKRITSITVYGKQRYKPRSAGAIDKTDKEVFG